MMISLINYNDLMTFFILCQCSTLRGVLGVVLELILDYLLWQCATYATIWCIWLKQDSMFSRRFLWLQFGARAFHP